MQTGFFSEEANLEAVPQVRAKCALIPAGSEKAEPRTSPIDSFEPHA